MELTSQQLVQIKQISLELFKSFIKVCEKLNLNYYVLGGTMLGAVRHKGFIPWDDDIDVGMPRKDYNIFTENAQSFLPEYYFLQTYITDPEYMLGYAKLRDSRTAYIETAFNKKKNMNHGVFIDVFPLDYYPDAKLKQFMFDKKMIIYNKRVRDTLNIEHPTSLRAEVFTKIALKLLPDLYKACVKRDKLISSVKPSGTLANIYGAWGKKEYVPYEWFGKGTELEFEGIRVRAPEYYDKWLTQVYGDYMTLPPVEKRKSHHNVDIVDFDNSYKIYNK